MKRKKIEKEQNHFFRDYASVIKAVIVFIILVGLLVGVVLFKPKKKEEIKDPSILATNEKNINTNDATCDGPNAPKLREAASKIFIQYEEVPDYLIGYMEETDEDLNGNGIIDTEPVVENRGWALKLKVNNLTEDLYISVESDVDAGEDPKYYRYSDVDENGQVIWYETETSFLRTYTIKILSASKDCAYQVYREFTTTIPRYNQYSRSVDCMFEPMKSDKVCNPFLWEDRTYAEDAKEFKRVMKEYVQKEAKAEQEQKEKEEAEKAKANESLIDKTINWVKDNYIIAAGVVVGLIIIVALIIKRVKKK